MAQAGFRILMISKSDHDVGGDCLNDGCVPSKAFIHVAKLAHSAKLAAEFGLNVSGKVDMQKATGYVRRQQDLIREHENADWLRRQGIDVALGKAHFTGKNEVEISGKRYSGKKIVIATGSQPRKLRVDGVELVTYYDNESIFNADVLPEKLLVVGGGPIGIEIGQAMSRLGSRVMVVHSKDTILEHDDKAVTAVLFNQLQKEGIGFMMNSKVKRFISSAEATVEASDGSESVVTFDAVFAAVGRHIDVESLQLSNAGISVKDGAIVSDSYLTTSNPDVFVCGDVAGDLKFSHAAEFHARILLNNLFSPLNKKLDNRHLSWVTFTDPEVATFGWSESQLKEKGIGYERLEQDFEEDDRAVTDHFQYAKMVLFIGSKGFLKKQKILGGTMVAPHAGELIQELILANTEGLSMNVIFNKIYPYPVASRINQKLVVEYKSKSLTGTIKSLLKFAYKLFS